MQKILIDTDIAIDFLRGESAGIELLIELWEHGVAYFSILSTYELYAGMRENELEPTDNFINACKIAPVNLEISQLGGELYRHYRKKGKTLTTVDCLLFATAKINKLLSNFFEGW